MKAQSLLALQQHGESYFLPKGIFSRCGMCHYNGKIWEKCLLGGIIIESERAARILTAMALRAQAAVFAELSTHT